VIFLLEDDPGKYHEFAAEKHGSGLTRMTALNRFLDPATSLDMS
jgi:hypothetical protein